MTRKLLLLVGRDHASLRRTAEALYPMAIPVRRDLLQLGDYDIRLFAYFESVMGHRADKIVVIEDRAIDRVEGERLHDWVRDVLSLRLAPGSGNGSLTFI